VHPEGRECLIAGHYVTLPPLSGLSAPAIHKEATVSAFRPIGCRGTECTSVLVLVLSLTSQQLIPDDAALYRCNVSIAANAAGTYAMGMHFVIASTPEGASVPGAAGVDGAIVVSGGDGG
jgi:hypothetical protein